MHITEGLPTDLVDHEIFALRYFSQHFEARLGCNALVHHPEDPRQLGTIRVLRFLGRHRLFDFFQQEGIRRIDESRGNVALPIERPRIRQRLGESRMREKKQGAQQTEKCFHNIYPSAWVPPME